jgi:hypothetical protein
MFFSLIPVEISFADCLDQGWDQAAQMDHIGPRQVEWRRRQVCESPCHLGS